MMNANLPAAIVLLQTAGVLVAPPGLPAAEPAGPDPWAGVKLPSLQIQHAGLTPAQAVAALVLPAGFSAKLFSSEPDVQQPIACALDDRGRLWVAEAHAPQAQAANSPGQDRILVFEDTDGDGKFEKRTVFTEGLTHVTGLEVGFGGVWIGAAPNLMYFSIKEGEDKPDGAPKVLLDGWGWQGPQQSLSSLAWGPDGWLYGCQGNGVQSNVGKPGAPDDARVRLTAGIWRYHPTKKRFELFATGPGNPHGLDFDARGQCFVAADGLAHLYHIVQGGRYSIDPASASSAQPSDAIPGIADHGHLRGEPASPGTVPNGPARPESHAGLMIYPGGSWPDKYRGQIFTGDLTSHRISMDLPERTGSGFVVRPGPDFIKLNDAWSEVVALGYDQSGSVYLVDRYGVDGKIDPRGGAQGRVFKILYQDRHAAPDDLQMKLDGELCDLLVSRNEWYARHVQRVLQERGGSREMSAALIKTLRRDPQETHKLRLLWSLHAGGALTERLAASELKNRSEYVRAWAIQLLCENRQPSAEACKQFTLLAQTDPSPVVRLYLAAAVQRIPAGPGREILQALLAHAEDADDPNLPWMDRYAAERVLAEDPAQAGALLANTKIPLVREYLARRANPGASPPAPSPNG